MCNSFIFGEWSERSFFVVDVFGQLTDGELGEVEEVKCESFAPFILSSRKLTRKP